MMIFFVFALFLLLGKSLVLNEFTIEGEAVVEAVNDNSQYRVRMMAVTKGCEVDLVFTRTHLNISTSHDDAVGGEVLYSDSVKADKRKTELNKELLGWGGFLYFDGFRASTCPDRATHYAYYPFEEDADPPSGDNGDGGGSKKEKLKSGEIVAIVVSCIVALLCFIPVCLVVIVVLLVVVLVIIGLVTVPIVVVAFLVFILLAIYKRTKRPEYLTPRDDVDADDYDDYEGDDVNNGGVEEDL